MRITFLAMWTAFLLVFHPGWASGSGITYHGRLLKPNGRPVTASNVQFRLQIRTPGSSSSCLLFEEIHTADLSASNGVFSITLNDGTATSANAEPYSLLESFQNYKTLNFPSGKCTGTDTQYVPNAADGRQLFVSFNDGTFAGWEPLPAQMINFTPLSLEAMSLSGHRASHFFRVVDSGNLQTLSPWSPANYQKLLDLVGNTTISGGNASIGGTASGFTGSLSGDVTGGQSSTKVEKIQGRDVLDSAPANGQVLTWNNAQTRWEAANLPAASAPSWNDITGKPSTFPAGGSAGGDLSGSYPNPVIASNAVTSAKITDGAVGPSKLTAGSATGQVLRYDTGSGWAATKLNFMDLVNSFGASPWPTGTCVAGEAIVWESISDGFKCQAISFTEADPQVGINTLNMLSKWDGNALVASSIYENGGNVGIGTTDPQSKLDVSGAIRATDICDETGANCKDISSGWGAGGSVTSVTAGMGLVTSPGGGITTSGSIGIATGGVSTTELASGAVTTTKIQDGNVTGVKLETLAGLTAGSYGTASAVPAITVDTKGRITAISTNAITGLLPTATGVNGKYLKSDGTNWSGQDIRFSDIKNIGGTSAFNVGSCAANQTVAWSSLTDTFTCQDIGSLDASKITTGTLNAARLPSSVTDGLWTASGGNVYRSTGSVGIGTTSPNAASVLELSSTTKGFLPPRMTTVQRDAISSPTAGLTIFNTTTNLLQVFDGATWGNTSGSATQEVVQGASVNIPVAGTPIDIISLTVTTGGKYLVLASGNTNGANPWTYFSSTCYLMKNGSQIDYKYFYYGTGGGGSGAGMPQMHYSLQTLATGDVLKARCFVTSDGPSASATNWKISLMSTGISNISGADNLGSHTATQNLNLSSYQLVGNGGSDGIAIANSGNVGIGTSSPTNKLEVVGGPTKLEQEPWTYPSSLSASWLNYGAGYGNFGYRKDSMGYLRLRGLIKNGVAGSSFFTLPLGYRPLVSLEFSVAAANGSSQGVANVIIHPSGIITIETMSSNAWVSFDNVSLPLD